MKKSKYKETVTVDNIRCVYCGAYFDGERATNYSTQENTATCPECGETMSIFQSIEYTAFPLDE